MDNNKCVQQAIKAIPLCSRCIVNEISGWIADKKGEINPEATQQVREELKAIKLVPGECLVCQNNLVSGDTFESILKAFNKHNVKEGIKEEFKKLFGFCF